MSSLLFLRNIFFVLYCVVTYNALGQPSVYEANKKIPLDELRRDFVFMRASLEEAHPSLYWYTPKESLDEYFDETAAQLTHDMTEWEFWKVIQPLVAKIRCGHTDLRLTQGFRRYLFRKRKNPFPFQFSIQGDELFVVRNDSDDSTLVAGTQILAIEGVSTSKILRTIRKYLPGDGYTDAFKDATLENGYFDEYYWLVFGPKEEYELTVKDNAENVRTVLPRLNPKRPRPQRVWLNREEERQRKLISMREITYSPETPATAILKLNSFGYDEYESYQTFHENVFKELETKGIRHLVIDLRKNIGGNHEIALDLMKYLTFFPFVLTESGESPVKKPTFIDLFETDDQGRMPFNARMVKENKQGKFMFDTPSVGTHLPYDQYRFRGTLYILTSGQTFSAASSFLASLKVHRPLTTIGQETGGGEAGCNGGIISHLILPYSQLRLRFPHFKILTASKKPNIGRGVLPDFEIRYTPQQKAQKIDLEMEKTFELIRKNELAAKARG
jgi:hypothetical protein